jgi:DNA polymerase III delta prime subunit
MIGNEFLWTEKYRPRTVKDTILPKHLKAIFQKFVDQKDLPNLLLYGTSGVGKTSVALAALDEIGCDSIKINASWERNLDTLETKVKQFASSISISGGRKYVIFDEADWLNANSTQPALKTFMEDYSKNCGFIFTCNFKNRILDAIHSRCSLVNFKISKEEKAGLAQEFFKRVQGILDTEKVAYDPKAVAALITMHFPDFRRTLNELQTYSASGKIDSGILAQLSDESFKKLIGFMKEKNFSEIRKWVGTIEPDSGTVFRRLYDTVADTMKAPQDISTLVVVLAEYQYKAAFVADHQINLVACLVEIMANCNFK